jgi:hypothetical protein
MLESGKISAACLRQLFPMAVPHDRHRCLCVKSATIPNVPCSFIEGLHTRGGDRAFTLVV